MKEKGLTYQSAMSCFVEILEWLELRRRVWTYSEKSDGRRIWYLRESARQKPGELSKSRAESFDNETSQTKQLTTIWRNFYLVWNKRELRYVNNGSHLTKITKIHKIPAISSVGSVVVSCIFGCFVLDNRLIISLKLFSLLSGRLCVFWRFGEVFTDSVRINAKATQTYITQKGAERVYHVILPYRECRGQSTARCSTHANSESEGRRKPIFT